jgi:hypothetical protein
MQAAPQTAGMRLLIVSVVFLLSACGATLRVEARQ